MTDQNSTPSPTIKNRVLNLLLEIDDKTTLLEIARSIHKQVLAMNSPIEADPQMVDDVVEELSESAPVEQPLEASAQNRTIQIELKDETWHATRMADGRSFGLCTRLSRNEVERQMRVKAPQKASWELSVDEARQLQRQDSQLVDYWDEKKGNITTRHFYLLEEYQAAMDDWHKYIELAKDEKTVLYRFSVAARAAIAKLESEGYEIIFPQEVNLQAAE